MTIPVYDAPKYFARRYFNGIWPSGVGVEIPLPIEEFLEIYAKPIPTEVGIGISLQKVAPRFAVRVQAAAQLTFAATRPQDPSIIAKISSEDYIQVRIKSDAETRTVGTLVIPNRLDNLLDVNPEGEIAGATVIYDANTDTYFVKRANYDELEGVFDPSTISTITGGKF
jgi:hypothetical protein